MPPERAHKWYRSATCPLYVQDSFQVLCLSLLKNVLFRPLNVPKAVLSHESSECFFTSMLELFLHWMWIPRNIFSVIIKLNITWSLIILTRERHKEGGGVGIPVLGCFEAGAAEVVTDDVQMQLMHRRLCVEPPPEQNTRVQHVK